MAGDSVQYGTLFAKEGHGERKFERAPVDFPKYEDLKGENAAEKHVNWHKALVRYMSEQQKEQFRRRAPMAQWLDENELEWNTMNRFLIRNLQKWSVGPEPEPYAYPFREVCEKLGEELLGDDKAMPVPKVKRGEAKSDVLTQVLVPKSYPVHYRIICFAPWCGEAKSLYMPRWEKISGEEFVGDAVDIWVVSWQGWADFGVMMNHVAKAVLSFADSMTTVFYGHGMGGIVAYETAKRLESYCTPGRPAALVVSGCPPPHLFPEKYGELQGEDMNRAVKLMMKWSGSYKDHQEAQQEFGIIYNNVSEPTAHARAVDMLGGGSISGYVDIAGVNPTPPPKHDLDSQGMCLGLTLQLANYQAKIMTNYKEYRKIMGRENGTPDAASKIAIPIYAYDSPNDDFVEESDVAQWEGYTHEHFTQSFLEGNSKEECNDLDYRCHAYSHWGCAPLLRAIASVLHDNALPDKMDHLPDIGDTASPLPGTIDCLVVGAGNSGISTTMRLLEAGINAYCIDRKSELGGKWRHYGNDYSCMNTPEPASRIVDQGDGAYAYTNDTYATRADVVHDLFLCAASNGKDRYRLGRNLKKIDKNADGTYSCSISNSDGSSETIICKGVSLCVNRRTGTPRIVEYVDESKFLGEVYYGYGNDIQKQEFHGKKVVIVGCGVFAFENLRMVLERGARNVTMLARRMGTACPKWIDYVNYMRPRSADYSHPVKGDVAVFDAWKEAYKTVGADTPPSWASGSLKPMGASICVSDVFFLASYLGMCRIKQDGVRKFKPDGHGVTLKSGDSLDFDVMIKCTGFHLNREVESITGHGMMYPDGYMAPNLAYLAEPLLDSGPFNNPFGSSNTGFMTTASMSYVQMFKKTDVQVNLLESQVKEYSRTIEVTNCWASRAINFNPMYQSDTSEFENLAQIRHESGWDVRTAASNPDPTWHAVLDDQDEVGGVVQKRKIVVAKKAPKLESGLNAPTTKPIGLLFPGQGSQYVKMMDGVKDMPAVKEMLAKAKPILGYDLLDLCLNGPDDKLEETKYCQPAMFVSGLAGVEKLRSQNKDAAEKFQGVGGLSLGEYTALTVAGVLTFEAGLKLVKLRGEAMQEAAQVGGQGMMSVVGLSKEKLADFCEQARKKEGKDAVCQIANNLFPQGFACAGTKTAVEELKKMADENGAKQARLLKTAGAFHTPMMLPAQQKLEAALAEALPNMKPPKCAIYMNVTGKVLPAGTDPKTIVPMLKDQLTNPVLWEQCCKSMIQDGMKEFYECGPQKQLTAMMKRIDPTMAPTTTPLGI